MPGCREDKLLITQNTSDPDRWQRLLKAIHEAQASGAPLSGQVACRPVGVLLGVGATLTPFSAREAFQELRPLSSEDRLARMRDPETRARILSSPNSDKAIDLLSPSRVRAITRWDRMYTFGPEVDYEPSEDRCVVNIAARSNRTAEEVASVAVFLAGSDSGYVTGQAIPVDGGRSVR